MDFEKEGTLIFSGRNTIKIIEIDGVEAVVKRFHRPNFIQKIFYTFFRKTKAYRAYHNGKELILRGFDTPKPIKYIETKKQGLIDYCYYITDRNDNPPIEDLTDRDDWGKQLATEFGKFVAQMHKQGILHHDLNDTNVRYSIQNSDPKYSFSLIDINRMKFYPLGSEIPLRECLDNLTRFTGRYDLFEYVIREYAKARMLDVESTTTMALKIKSTHDRNWYRRKKFTKKLKTLIGILK